MPINLSSFVSESYLLAVSCNHLGQSFSLGKNCWFVKLSILFYTLSHGKFR